MFWIFTFHQKRFEREIEYKRNLKIPIKLLGDPKKYNAKLVPMYSTEKKMEATS